MYTGFIRLFAHVLNTMSELDFGRNQDWLSNVLFRIEIYFELDLLMKISHSWIFMLILTGNP